MPATFPPAKAPPAAIRPTATAYGDESKKLHDIRAEIINKNKVTVFWQSQDGGLELSEEAGIFAEADLIQSRTLDDLAEARRRFLASTRFSPVDANLPAVLLSEG